MAEPSVPAAAAASGDPNAAPSGARPASARPVVASGPSPTDAIAQLVAQATLVGANALLDVRTRRLDPATAEAIYLAYGDAVRVEPG